MIITLDDLNFDRNLLQRAYWGEFDTIELVEEKIVGKKRWEVIYDLIFRNKLNGFYYKVNVNFPATEAQYVDDNPFEFATICRVQPVEKITVVYEELK
jgi:hypothetical protein